MGSSCDWSRERFTFDAPANKLVEHVFIDLYAKGLIYRGEYMVNYSPGLQSVISDLEVDMKEEESFMYYITYFVSGSDNEFTIATTRPETLLADMAVAVHPKDKRYKKMIGKILAEAQIAVGRSRANLSGFLNWNGFKVLQNGHGLQSPQNYTGEKNKNIFLVSDILRTT